MIKVPPAIMTQFEKRLEDEAIAQRERWGYRKWLRFYLDFCHKYGFSDARRGSLRHFLAKLVSKRQSTAQRQQASHAISLYYEILHSSSSPSHSKLRRADRPALKVYPESPYAPDPSSGDVGTLRETISPAAAKADAARSARPSSNTAPPASA